MEINIINNDIVDNTIVGNSINNDIVDNTIVGNNIDTNVISNTISTPIQLQYVYRRHTRRH
jgi:hypothetical protein